MSIGEMRRRLTLQQPQDPPSADFDDVETVWGSLLFLTATGPEVLRGGGPLALALYRAQIPYRTDIRAEWRVKDVETDRVYQISGCGDATGKRQYLDMMLTEIQ